MKVYVQVVNSRTGGCQHEMIEEPVMEGYEVENALGHLGIDRGEITWDNNTVYDRLCNSPQVSTGRVEGTDKIINVVVI